MKSRFIVIDGKTYKSVDEMPEEVRRKYEEAMQKLDKNQNGVPDMLEGGTLFEDKDNNGMPDALEGLASLAHEMDMTTPTRILVNGQKIDGIDQLPPEVRAKYEKAMSKLDANHNGVPDFMEGMINNQSSQMTSNSSTGFATPIPPPAPASRNPIPANPMIEPESTGNWIAILAGIALIGFCLLIAAAGVWYFFLR